MSRLAFVFPGQGSQYVGMGRELADSYEAAARIFADADAICGYELSSICFNGARELLDQTVYAQPAILVTSLACLAVAQAHGLSAQIVSGLSLGEYTALVAAGALGMEQALPLVMKRAQLMQDAVPLGRGAMAAVLGLDDRLVEDVCCRVEGVVKVANYNCPGQLVISGEKEAVEIAAAKLKEHGGKTRLLAISVPSHSPLMQECSQKFAREVGAVQFKEPALGVVSNVNAMANNASEFPGLLVEQLYSPVRWEQSVNYMMDRVDYFVELGPGSSLSGLIRKIDRTRVLGQVEDIKSLQKLLEKVKEI
ncbi:MAG: ACP S-malonyltransferase [Syntrophomonadaceae bacterium]|nr:ACP S-malonyltransferase [Syntrophomonadaceae bacterium]